MHGATIKIVNVFVAINIYIATADIICNTSTSLLLTTVGKFKYFKRFNKYFQKMFLSRSSNHDVLFCSKSVTMATNICYKEN